MTFDIEKRLKSEEFTNCGQYDNFWFNFYTKLTLTSLKISNLFKAIGHGSHFSIMNSYISYDILPLLRNTRVASVVHLRTLCSYLVVREYK